MHTRTGTGWLTGVLALSGTGLAIAAYLSKLHLDLFYGSGVTESLCDLGGSFNCSAVNASPESEIFGIPQALLAIPVYLLTALIGILGHRKTAPTQALALSVLGGLAVLYSMRLAFISATVIGAWCLFCIALYGVNIGLFALGLWGSGVSPTKWLPESVRAMVQAPLFSLGLLLGGGTLLGGSVAGYEQLRANLAAKAAAAAVAAPPAPAANAKPENAGSGGESKKVRLGSARADVVPPKNAPSIGPKDARVTIVEFSDFQCPFCKRLAGTLRQLTEEYPKDIRLVYAQFPMSTDCNHGGLAKNMHPMACGAATAAVCAGEQGKFWEMHDRLFDQQASQNAKMYLESATALELDTAKFQSCLDNPAIKQGIIADTELGGGLGVAGTPTFFINGRVMSGAQPIEVLRAVVEAELAGNHDALELEVTVGTEITGPLPGTVADEVAISALSGIRIDSFEASLNGKKAESKAGVAPARGISWYDAKAACEQAGKRLCTESEWMAACTGTAPVDADHNGIVSDDTILGLKYGYGDSRREGLCADARNPAAIGELLTGNHPRCSTPTGAYDMVGGVKEWVGLSPATAGLKGGSYSSGESARCGYYRDDIAPDTEDQANGFRCCEGPTEIPPARPGKDVGEQLEALELPLFGGGTVKTRSFSGHPLIITFWASWCGPCQKEMPALASLYNRYKAQGLQVLGISVDEDNNKLSNWLSTHEMPFPIAQDPGGKVMNSFTERGLPTTLWVRKDGLIRLRTTGVPPGAEKRLEELVNELMR